MKFGKFTSVMCSLACLLIVAFAVTASADSYFKQQTYTGAMEMMGNSTPERYDTTETWVTKNRAYAILPGDYAFLIKVDEGIGISINHNDSSYAEIPLDFDKLFAGATDSSEEAEEAKKMAEQMMGQMDITVTTTEETKKIKDWNTKKYILEIKMGMMGTKSNVWATQDIDIDYDLYYLATNAMMASMPGFEDLVSEFNKIKGITVLSEGEIDMMGSKTTSSNELLEYKEATPPAGIYEIPAGYKKISMPGMGK